jgi:hypothetical protein
VFGRSEENTTLKYDLAYVPILSLSRNYLHGCVAVDHSASIDTQLLTQVSSDVEEPPEKKSKRMSDALIEKRNSFGRLYRVGFSRWFGPWTSLRFI